MIANKFFTSSNFPRSSLCRCIIAHQSGSYVYSLFIVLLYVLFVCKFALYYCRRVSTQLQLTNMSYHIIIIHHMQILRTTFDTTILYETVFNSFYLQHSTQPYYTKQFLTPSAYNIPHNHTIQNSF
jgi:hypothetical protein